MATTIKGPAIFLAQFAADQAPFNSWPAITKWAAALGYKGVQVPSWDGRLFDIAKAAASPAYCDEIKGIARDNGVEITELSTHLQGQLVAVHPAYDEAFDAFAPAAVHGKPKDRRAWGEEQVKLAAKASQNMMAGHHKKDTQRHTISNPRVTINGHRAVNEYYVILYQGRVMDGYEFDLTTWSVTLDLFEKRNDEWRICKRSNIYEKDRFEPHVPGSVPNSYYENLDLSAYPPAIRFHCYRNERSSGQVPKNLIMKGSPEEVAARKEVAAWVAGR